MTSYGRGGCDGVQVKFRPLMYVRMVAHLILFPAVYLALPIYLKWDSEPSKIYVVWVRFASFMVYLFASGFFFGIFSQVRGGELCRVLQGECELRCA
jgi:hypothetical protein